MTTGFSGKERVFVDCLPAETGRDLAAWMAAIGASGLSHRNDIIDWLRQEGFSFSNASWMERIHHNGGRLIYGDLPEKAGASAPKRKAAGVAVPRPTPLNVAARKADAEIDALLAAAKAYRPLAQVLLRDILAAVPGADASAQDGLIVICHARPFAAILAGAKDVRLFLGLAGIPGQDWLQAKRPGSVDNMAGLTHMLVLTDARQLTRELKELIAASARAAGA